MNKLIVSGIIIFILIGCAPTIVVDYPIVESPPISPTINNVIEPEPTVTLSINDEQFQKNLLHYKVSIEQCAIIETGEYIKPDVAILYWESLNNDLSLFYNPDFINAFVWLMDETERYCTNHSVDDPVFAITALNDLLFLADKEYFQYQKQARTGIQAANMGLIENAFSHRQKARDYINESAYYYDRLMRNY